jgi:hypothetical protein
MSYSSASLHVLHTSYEIHTRRPSQCFLFLFLSPRQRYSHIAHLLSISTILLLLYSYGDSKTMSKVVPQGSWTDPLNWDLHITHEGEPCIPFHLHVQPESRDQPASSFPQFIQLPVELQHYIMCFCGRAVLYQLMHASPTTRKEAKKLFWSEPETWYSIHGEWLLAGGFAGHTNTAMDALSYMHQIEVDFGATGPLEFHAWRGGIHQYKKKPLHDIIWQEHIHDFWQTLQRCFPSVTDVVLSQTYAAPPDTGVPAELGILAEKSPAGIHTSISCLRREVQHYTRLNRVLWRQVYSGNDQLASWEVFRHNWSRRSVLPPPKSFRGPVGAFCRIGYEAVLRSYQHWACRYIFIYAVEAYYLQEKQAPYTCLALGCDLQFELPGQWAAHAIDTRHDEEIKLPDQQTMALFYNHVARVKGMEHQYPDAIARMQIEWGKQGSQQRSTAEHAFLSQLQHDPLYVQDKPPRESDLWIRFQRAMEKET